MLKPNKINCVNESGRLNSNLFKGTGPVIGDWVKFIFNPKLVHNVIKISSILQRRKVENSFHCAYLHPVMTYRKEKIRMFKIRSNAFK